MKYDLVGIKPFLLGLIRVACLAFLPYAQTVCTYVRSSSLIFRLLKCFVVADNQMKERAECVKSLYMHRCCRLVIFLVYYGNLEFV